VTGRYEDNLEGGKVTGRVVRRRKGDMKII
jgi:hypothetical protein